MARQVLKQPPEGELRILLRCCPFSATILFGLTRPVLADAPAANRLQVNATCPAWQETF